MRRTSSAVLAITAAAAVVGAGAAAGHAATGTAGVTSSSVTVIGADGPSQCAVKLSWRPNPYARVDHFEVRYATTQAGLALETPSVASSSNVIRSTARGEGAWFELTPVLSDGTSGINVVRGIGSVTC